MITLQKSQVIIFYCTGRDWNTLIRTPSVFVKLLKDALHVQRNTAKYLMFCIMRGCRLTSIAVCQAFRHVSGQVVVQTVYRLLLCINCKYKEFIFQNKFIIWKVLSEYSVPNTFNEKVLHSFIHTDWVKVWDQFIAKRHFDVG